MKIGILTMEAHENRERNSVGSSRIRGNWLVKYWPDAEIYRIGKKYDALIFQKVYFDRLAEAFHGPKILDICDPDWLEGREVKKMIELCDAVTCSSKALRDFLKTITSKPVYYIPDRMDIEAFSQQKEHRGRAKSVVWFGYSSNHPIIDQVLYTIKKLGLQLTVISEQPYYPSTAVQDITTDWLRENVKYIKYDQDSINEEIIYNGDIVINPRSDYGKYKFKSDNKNYTAWALGMPVARTADDLERFLEEAARVEESKQRRAHVQKYYRTELSVEQYKTIFAMISKDKQNDKANIPA